MTTKEHSQDAGLVPGSLAPEPRPGHSLQCQLLDVTKQLKMLHTKVLDTQDCSGQSPAKEQNPQRPQGSRDRNQVRATQANSSRGERARECQDRPGANTSPTGPQGGRKGEPRSLLQSWRLQGKPEGKKDEATLHVHLSLPAFQSLWRSRGLCWGQQSSSRPQSAASSQEEGEAWAWTLPPEPA